MCPLAFQILKMSFSRQTEPKSRLCQIADRAGDARQLCECLNVDDTRGIPCKWSFKLLQNCAQQDRQSDLHFTAAACAHGVPARVTYQDVQDSVAVNDASYHHVCEGMGNLHRPSSSEQQASREQQ